MQKLHARFEGIAWSLSQNRLSSSDFANLIRGTIYIKGAKSK